MSNNAVKKGEREGRDKSKERREKSRARVEKRGMAFCQMGLQQRLLCDATLKVN